MMMSSMTRLRMGNRGGIEGRNSASTFFRHNSFFYPNLLKNSFARQRAFNSNRLTFPLRSPNHARINPNQRFHIRQSHGLVPFVHGGV